MERNPNAWWPGNSWHHRTARTSFCVIEWTCYRTRDHVWNTNGANAWQGEESETIIFHFQKFFLEQFQYYVERNPRLSFEQNQHYKLNFGFFYLSAKCSEHTKWSSRVGEQIWRGLENKVTWDAKPKKPFQHTSASWGDLVFTCTVWIYCYANMWWKCTKSSTSYWSNRPLFLSIYCCNNPHGMLREFEKSLWIWLVIFKLLECSPNIPKFSIENLRGIVCCEMRFHNFYG